MLWNKLKPMAFNRGDFLVDQDEPSNIVEKRGGKSDKFEGDLILSVKHIDVVD